MRTKKQRVDDVIISVYRSQLKKYLDLAVYDEYGQFLYGGETEFGTTVTHSLIDITRKRLSELQSKRLNLKGVSFENKQNGEAK